MICHALSENVYRTLESVLNENRFEPTVLKMLDSSDTYPKVVIQELSNTQNVKDGNGMISYSFIQIEVDIYAMNTNYGEEEYSGSDVAKELIDICNEVIDGIFGMKRESWKPSVDVQNGVYRLTVVYQAIQDDLRKVLF